jgi:monoamine oxidase
MNRKIERIQYTQHGRNKTTKVELSWRDVSNPKKPSSHLRTSTFDYALISASFPVVRSWRLPSSLPTTITNAINNLGYASACKVALEYSSRFWEHYANPIVGGCSTTTDIRASGRSAIPVTTSTVRARRPSWRVIPPWNGLLR